MGTLIVGDKKLTPLELVILSKLKVSDVDESSWKSVPKPVDVSGQIDIRIDYHTKIGEDTKSESQTYVNALGLLALLLRDKPLTDAKFAELCSRVESTDEAVLKELLSKLAERVKSVSQKMYPEKTSSPVRGRVTLDASITVLNTVTPLIASAAEESVEEVTGIAEEFVVEPTRKRGKKPK